MSVTIAGTEFERHHYDDRGDVLYLNVSGYDGRPASAIETVEGHNVEYDENGCLVSLVLVNVRWSLERDGEVAITWPAGHLGIENLARAMQPAA